MQFDILCPIEDLLLTLPDGTLPIHELFKLMSHRPDGTPFENYHWDQPSVNISRYAPQPDWGPEYVEDRRVVVLEYPSDYSFMDPGGHHDVNVWENYSVATYWGYGAGQGETNDPYRDHVDYYGVFKYLDRIGYIKLKP